MGGCRKKKKDETQKKKGKHNQSITKVKKIPRGSRENFGNALICSKTIHIPVLHGTT